MSMSDRKLIEWMEALASEGLDRDALGDLEAELLGKVGRLRKDRDRTIRDMEAARLLPTHGPDAAATRLGVCRRSVYYMADRARKESAKPAETVAQIA